MTPAHAPSLTTAEVYDRDRQWAAAIGEGDDAAFEALFRAYYPELQRFARYHVRADDVAEGLVQEVFLHVWKSRHTWNPRGAVRAYLYAAVRNQARKHLRRRRLEQRWMVPGTASAEAEPAGAPGPEEHLCARSLADTYRRLLAEVPERRRLVFMLSRQHGLSYAEIGAVLGISTKTVETQMGRVLKFLRANLHHAGSIVGLLLGV